MSEENEQLEEKAAYPLHIFFSYGHRDHVEKVKAIKAALEKRGHTVWLDTEGGINHGNDWRRNILKGIEESQMVLAFLSEYSMRDPGVCRDELQISIGCKGGNIKTVLLEPLENVRPPATISHCQWLDLSSWDGNSKELPGIVEKIVKMIETKENFVFDDEIEMLRQILNPVSYDGRIRELCSRKMYGREWLNKELHEWDESNASQLFWLVGGAGFGKSMFSANLCMNQNDKVVAAQFIEWDKPNIFEPTAILKNLAFQLAKRYPDYRKYIVGLPIQTRDKLEKSDGGYSEEELCDILFCEQAGLCIDGNHESAWVILDALDEATRNDENTIARTLARHVERFPKWLKFIITSRDDAAVRMALQSFKPNVYDVNKVVRIHQDEDMLKYLCAELEEFHYSENTLKSLVKKSNGMFLYLRFACETIKESKLTAKEIGELPQGITGFYADFFKRQFGKDKYSEFRDKVRPVLELCRSAYEALPLVFLAEALGWEKEQLQLNISLLGTLKIDREENDKNYFHLCHKSIWDWLEAQPNVQKSFRVARENGQKNLVEFCLKKIGEYKMNQFRKDDNYDYPLRHIVRHLVEQKNEEKIWELLGGTDPKLPKAQNEYFENYSVAMVSCKQAIRFYFDYYQETKKPQILPKLSRLIITYRKLYAKQQEYLRDVFAKDNSLQKTLDIMAGISDVKTYFVIGCYLLGQAKERNWDIDKLIDAIVKKCGDNLDALDSDDRVFLANGPLSGAVQDMTSKQLIALLKVINNRRSKRAIYEDISARLELPQLAEARWYFIKRDDTGRGRLRRPYEKVTVIGEDDIDAHCKALIDSATKLYVSDQKEEALQMIKRAEELLPQIVGDFSVQSLVEDIAEFYHNIGQNDKAGQLLMANQKAFGTDYKKYVTELCKCSFNKEAYVYFEESVLPKSEESTAFLESCLIKTTILQKLASDGQGDVVANFLKDNDKILDLLGNGKGLLEIFEALDKTGQNNIASQLLHDSFEKCEDKNLCLLKTPKLVKLIEEFANEGYWTDAVPSLKEALDAILSPVQDKGMLTLSDFQELSRQILTEAEPLEMQLAQEIQLEFIRQAWNCFLREVATEDYEKREKAFTNIELIMTRNSLGLSQSISNDVKELLKYLQNEPISIQEGLTIRWLKAKRFSENTILGDTLLLDTITEDEITDYFRSFETRLLGEAAMVDAVKNGLQDILCYYLLNEKQDLLNDLLNRIKLQWKEKLDMVVDVFRDVISAHIRIKMRSGVNLQWQIPDSYLKMLQALEPFFADLSIDDMPFYSDALLKSLYEYREQPIAVKMVKTILDILDAKIRLAAQGEKTYFIESYIQAGSWILDKERFESWFAQMEENPRSRWKKEDGNWVEQMEAYLSYVEKTSEPPADWYSFAWEKIKSLKNDEKRKVKLVQLLRGVVMRGTKEQVEEVLSMLNNADLIANSRTFDAVDIVKLYSAFKEGGVSDTALQSIMKAQKWQELPFDKLCLLSEHLLDEDDYIKKWFAKLQEKLDESKHFDILKEILVSCPELGLSSLFEDKAKASSTTVSNEPLTPERLDAIGELVVCPNCSSKVPKGKFCPECGKPLAKPAKPVCPNCGKEYAPGAKFCQECGEKLV